MIPIVTAICSAAAAVFSALAAVFAASIAWLQWKTAQEKVLLDLFDRRFAVYEELRAAGPRARHGDQNGVSDFRAAASRAKLLFGAEVTAFLEATATDLAGDLVQWKSPRPASPEQHEAASDKLVARANRLDVFFRELDELVAPYMNHHQRRG
jgi:hypothetical protein